MPGTVTAALVGSSSSFIRKITCTCVADAAAATFPATILPSFEGRIQALLTIPGTPNPTAAWAVTITDAAGVDVLAGVGAGQSATVAKKVAVFLTGTDAFPPIAMSDILTLNISGNVINSAQLTVTLYYGLGG